MNIEVIEVLEKNEIYVLNLEEWWSEDDKSDKIKMVAAYSAIDGGYIGGMSDLMAIVGSRRIAPQKSEDNCNVCSIGFCKEENKWYGWSHRAISGFGVGHVTKKGECQAESGSTEEYLKDHPGEMNKVTEVGFECKTLDDCKKVALSFAASVS